MEWQGFLWTFIAWKSNLLMQEALEKIHQHEFFRGNSWTLIYTQREKAIYFLSTILHKGQKLDNEIVNCTATRLQTIGDYFRLFFWNWLKSNEQKMSCPFDIKRKGNDLDKNWVYRNFPPCFIIYWVSQWVRFRATKNFMTKFQINSTLKLEGTIPQNSMKYSIVHKMNGQAFFLKHFAIGGLTSWCVHTLPTGTSNFWESGLIDMKI